MQYGEVGSMMKQDRMIAERTRVTERQTEIAIIILYHQSNVVTENLPHDT